MEPETLAEKILVDAASPSFVSREEVRVWVALQQKRLKRRSRLLMAAFSVVFLAFATGQWLLLDNQARNIRQLVERQPPRAVVALREVTRELCDAEPAGYFVQQLTRRRTGHAVPDSTSPTL